MEDEGVHAIPSSIIVHWTAATIAELPTHNLLKQIEISIVQHAYLQYPWDAICLLYVW